MTARPDRVDAYHAPLAAWCASSVAGAARRPWVLGISGPQGCGKSTLASALVTALAETGVRGVAVSIDDFYLTHDQQLALAAAHPGNPCLQYRGYPGTHDVALGVRCIETVSALGVGEEARLPVYDKSAHDGRGDRAPVSSWRRVVGPVDCLIVEGWMLAFSPVDESTLPPDLVAPNRLLREYDVWTRKLDGLLMLHAPTLDTIVDWRVDSERARRERGETALSDEDARDYIERFLPAYRAYVPGLAARRMDPTSRPTSRLIQLGADRLPL
jgi:D-glycerate 3-kinase